MHTVFLFAHRYLISRKSLNAVNIVSVVSAIAIAAVAMALIVTLSVFNGYGDLIASQTAPLDPELLITDKNGRTFDVKNSSIQSAIQSEDIIAYSSFITRPALIKVANKQTVAMVMGVDEQYKNTTDITQILMSGQFALQDISNDSTAAYSIGIALAQSLGIGTGFVDPIDIYLPRRLGLINPLMPATAFRNTYGFVTSVFVCNREQYDNKLIIPIIQLRNLLSYEYTAADGICIKVKQGANIKSVQKKLQQLLGEKYIIADKSQQHPDMAQLVSMEKWMTFMILIFIILLALFNVVSSLSMLLMEKRQDINILRAIGADDTFIRRIFILSGTFITTIGTCLGLILGLILAYLQQEYGLISMQSGFVVDSYPVRIIWTDIITVLATIILLGYAAAIYPVRFFLRRTK